MKSILVTGFMPFGGENMNPAWEAMCLLPEEIGDVRLRRLHVPVSYDGSWRVLLAEATRCAPDALLLLGQAGGRAEVTVERYARNEMRCAVPDCDGALRQGEKIDPDGENMLASALALRLSPPLILSEDAGRYVCNCLYYHALHHFSVPCAFVHVPYCEKSLGAAQGQPFMRMEEIAQRVLAAAETTAGEL